MIVDSRNFTQARKLILDLQLIEKSEFICYDLQFTGLRVDRNDRQRLQQFPFERYEKMRNVVKKYAIIQVGLTFFLKQQGGNMVYPFNFYVFPRESTLGDPIISLQSSTADFNSNNDMDWTRWIKYGITFVKMTQKQQLMQKVSKNYDEMSQYLDETSKDTIKQILSASQQLSAQKQSTKILIPKQNSQYIKKLITKLTQEKNLSFKIDLDSNIMMKNSIQMISATLTFLSQQQKKILQMKAEQNIYGFTLLFQKIWQSKKKLVGHNCLFDLLYFYENFVAPIPQRWSTFKQQLSNTKLTFIDTKSISELFQRQDIPKITSLQGLKAAIQQKWKDKIQKISFNKQTDHYNESQAVLHEAGYDSFLTGWVYLHLCKIIGNNLVQTYQGVINLTRCYFMTRINGGDFVKPHVRPMVISLIPQAKFISRDDIRQTKQDLAQIRNKLKVIFVKNEIYEDISMHDSLKQVFIDIKNPDKEKTVIKILIEAVHKKEIAGELISFAQFIKTRGYLLGDARI